MGKTLVIFGLGNPGMEYADTRHNVGFMAINELAKKWGSGPFKQEKNICSWTSLQKKGTKVFLIKPLTFMNNSGNAVNWFKSYYKIPTENILVIYDDVALDNANIRIRKQGASGGHNGVENIIEHIGKKFHRIRVGVKGDHEIFQLHKYVLARFSVEEREAIDKSLEIFPEMVMTILSRGYDRAMNMYNNTKTKQVAPEGNKIES